MQLSAQAWMEISFNIAYLLAIWGLVAAMQLRNRQLGTRQRRLRAMFIAAFALLALGDTGHVGFRVLAYFQGASLSANLAGDGLGLVGLGALATAVTVTFFYAIMLLIWQQRFSRPLGWLGWLLILSAVLRLALMLFPENQWNNTIPPQPWSLYRNLPLVIQGLGVAYLILRDARSSGDHAFQWIGMMVLVSFAFYLPVILWVQRLPAIGMLMIPKTLAYVAIAVIAYRNLFLAPQRPGIAAPVQSEI